jgi:hypothetical protein
MSLEMKDLLKKLDDLSEKVDILIKVTAISAQMETLFKGKKDKDKIKMLADMELPRNIIALLVGTTALTVSVTLSKMKPKKAEPTAELKPAEQKVEHP